jgi:hypothetical protein
MITWAYLLGFFAVIAGVAAVVLRLVWRATRRIESSWWRHLPRALVAAMVVTPTVVPVPALHGALPLPAIWVLLSGVFGFGSEDRMLDIRHGGVPLLAVASVMWLLALLVTFLRSRSSGPSSNKDA